ncbi:hypothetical protein OROGR_008634 [Orobanche gracilis]
MGGLLVTTSPPPGSNPCDRVLLILLILPLFTLRFAY